MEGKVVKIKDGLGVEVFAEFAGNCVWVNQFPLNQDNINGKSLKEGDKIAVEIVPDGEDKYIANIK